MSPQDKTEAARSLFQLVRSLGGGVARHLAALSPTVLGLLAFPFSDQLRFVASVLFLLFLLDLLIVVSYVNQ